MVGNRIEGALFSVIYKQLRHHCYGWGFKPLGMGSRELPGQRGSKGAWIRGFYPVSRGSVTGDVLQPTWCSGALMNVLGWVIRLMMLSKVIHFQNENARDMRDRVSANTSQLPRRVSSNSALNQPFTPLGCLLARLRFSASEVLCRSKRNPKLAHNQAKQHRAKGPRQPSLHRHARACSQQC